MSETLLQAAKEAAGNAHAPYSRFAVGAAVLLADGSIVTGCNFENASYGLSLCAETVVLATLNAQGKLRQIREIAIVGGTLNRREIRGSSPVRPCGRCRQVMTEAAQLALRDIIVHCASADLSVVEKFWLSDLLPLPFGPSDMGLVQDD
ncbi:cytidine deaminase [Aquisediminimonas profunda]|uniref:cytidine deaminase n=1 Tax=Aquisediminimonas profunda TaxID=1550733 RepID=UPI001C626327|nr:cytidine deaminase [Aquisediminimonas profunda]